MVTTGGGGGTAVAAAGAGGVGDDDTVAAVLLLFDSDVLFMGAPSVVLLTLSLPGTGFCSVGVVDAAREKDALNAATELVGA